MKNTSGQFTSILLTWKLKSVKILLEPIKTLTDDILIKPIKRSKFTQTVSISTRMDYNDV